MSLREAMQAGRLLAAPGVYDGLSALLVQRSRAAAAYLSGYAVSASRYGLPDAGLVGMRDMIEALQIVARVCRKPIIADADTGYGGLLNVRHTVREYEAAGAAAIQLEDQELPKKCGHTQGTRVIEAREMVAKIEVAVEARRRAETLIVARTDARASLGLDAAIARARAYRRAGADLLFVEAPRSVDEMRRICGEVEAPLVVNVTPAGFQTPVLPLGELETMGYSLAIYPGLPALAGLAAMHDAVDRLLNEGVPPEVPLRVNPHDLVGFTEIWKLEELWQSRYGAEVEQVESVT